MNSSVYSADRATHLRIVALALMLSIAIVGFAVSARVNSIEMTQTIGLDHPRKAEMPGKEAATALSARPDTRRI
jgi:hypothetical protein